MESNLKLINVTCSIRDLWVGAYWLTYRRSVNDTLTPIATDIWVCLVPFIKFQFRILHCDLTEVEQVWIDEIQYAAVSGDVNDNVEDSTP